MTRASAVVVLMTAGSRREAERIAAALVEERLAACVNVVAGVTSIYRWRGAVERGREVLLVAKTRRALIQRLTVRVQALHAYDVPEVIALPIVAGAEPYLEWVVAETRASATRRARSGPRPTSRRTR